MMSRRGPHVVAARAVDIDLRDRKGRTRSAVIRSSGKWGRHYIDTQARHYRKWSVEQESMTLPKISIAKYDLRFVFG
jgi:hypothetical protein